MNILTKKILIINFSDVYGGQERYTKDLCELFSLSGAEVYYSGYKHPSYLSGISKFIDIKLKEKVIFDVVIFNGNNSLYKTILIKNILAKTKIYVQHSSINDDQGAFYKSIVRKFLLKLLLNRVDFIIRVSDSSLPNNFVSKPIVTIRNGVHLPVLQERINDFSKEIKLLMVGSVNRNKNQKLAIHLLVRSKKLKLTVVGSGDYIPILEDYAKSLGVSDQITWVGFVDDPSSFYITSDFYLMLSFNEAFPYVVLESMSFGTPVISVDVGGVSEVIVSEVNGIIVSDYSIDDLYGALIRSTESQSFYDRLSTNARESIVNSFSREMMFNSLITEIIKYS